MSGWMDLKDATSIKQETVNSVKSKRHSLISDHTFKKTTMFNFLLLNIIRGNIEWVLTWKFCSILGELLKTYVSLLIIGW